MGVWDTITEWLSYPSKPLDWTVRSIFDLFEDEKENQRRQIKPAQPPGGNPYDWENPPFRLPPVYPQGGGGTSRTDPMQEYLNQLLRGIGSGAPQMLSLQELRNMATSQVNPQFNPQIEAIRGEMSASKGRANKNKGELNEMYGALASSYGADAKASKAQTKENKNAEKAAYQQLQKDLQGQYSQQRAAQAEEFAKLGIQAALPEATQGQQEDLQFFTALNQVNTQAQQQAIDSMGMADQSYYSKGRGIAKMEGNEQVADLMARLEDYLRQSGSQVSQLEGQRSSAIEQLVNEMSMNQGQQMADYQNERWDRLLQVAQLQRALTNDSFSQQQALAKMAGGAEDPSKGLLGAYSVLENSLGGQSTNGINAFMNLLQTQPFREGRFEAKNDDIVEMTPENAAYQARLYAAQQKLSPAETDALVKAVYAYYGKLR